ncbi:hypothetical protein ASG43_03200 [Aureimonas sp. Leaf454]|uniref:hypothetical protein n=1 Tax=Aureimonas sp. Leaf454 TaxID=1736381 RepID=UPI0006FA779C|nr:hypothetical protein [Aureimonas sp. Leaf454]KQT54606.1 hypothetical protein ASG43_03200 [Aureimonas sp. Leaf454]
MSPETPMPNAVTPQTTGTIAGDEAKTALYQAGHYFQSPNSYSKDETAYVIDCLVTALKANKATTAATPPAADVTGEAGEIKRLKQLIAKIDDQLNEFGEAALPIVGETIGMWRHGQKLAATEGRDEPKPTPGTPKTRKYVIIRKPTPAEAEAAPATPPAADVPDEVRELVQRVLQERLAAEDTDSLPSYATRMEQAIMADRATRPAASGDGGGEVERLTQELAEETALRCGAIDRMRAAEAALASMTAERDRLREALEGLHEAVTNMELGEVDMRLAIKDARAALATPQADAGDRT